MDNILDLGVSIQCIRDKFDLGYVKVILGIFDAFEFFSHNDIFKRLLLLKSHPKYFQNSPKFSPQ